VSLINSSETVSWLDDIRLRFDTIWLVEPYKTDVWVKNMNLRKIAAQISPPTILKASKGLYLVACFTPALIAVSDGADHTEITLWGWQCLKMGALWLVLGLSAFFTHPISILSQYFASGLMAVFANPFLYVSWFFFSK
jgi:hypothetical protein